MTPDPDELPSDGWVAHAYCRCPLLPLPADEEVTMPARPLESDHPTRTRITLSCSAGGCGVTYTYVGGTPRTRHTGEDVELDASRARIAAFGWGWTGHIDDAGALTDRCPRHPIDEHLLDGGD